MRNIYWLALFIPSFLLSASNPFEEVKPQNTAPSCMERMEMKSSHTPELLFKSSALCIELEQYPKAVELYLVATAYGYFDGARVMDKSARQVLDLLKRENFSTIDAKKRNLFAEALRTRLDDMKPMCSFLEKLGRPNYHPSYMIQHGTQGPSQKSKNGLIPNYDATTLWHDTRFNYLRCP